jgi:predicted DNA-binding transcriptional regulator AlpA
VNKPMENIQPNDLIAVAEAQRLLGVSHAKIAQLIRTGLIRHFPNPLDRRVKLVSKAEVEALKPKRAEAA